MHRLINWFQSLPVLCCLIRVEFETAAFIFPDFSSYLLKEYLCVWVFCLHVFICTMCTCDVHGGQTRTSLGTGAMDAFKYMVGAEAESCARAASGSRHRVFFPQPHHLSFNQRNAKSLGTQTQSQSQSWQYTSAIAAFLRYHHTALIMDPCTGSAQIPPPSIFYGSRHWISLPQEG